MTTTPAFPYAWSYLGDLLIWQTILEIGRKHKRSLVFVSGEKKADWFYSSDRQGFFPRYELIDEYRRASEGGSFYILSLEELSRLYEIEASAVSAIKQAEVEEQRIVEHIEGNLEGLLNVAKNEIRTAFPGATDMPSTSALYDAKMYSPNRGTIGIKFEIRRRLNQDHVHLFVNDMIHTMNTEPSDNYVGVLCGALSESGIRYIKNNPMPSCSFLRIVSFRGHSRDGRVSAITNRTAWLVPPSEFG